VAAAAGSRQLRVVCGSRVWRVVFLALLTAMAVIVPLQLGFGWYVPPLQRERRCRLVSIGALRATCDTVGMFGKRERCGRPRCASHARVLCGVN
jgi:hypothetical protein